MVFNVPIMAISPRQPNSSHSINETPGLLHSISTQRHTTFGDIEQTPRITSPLRLSATLGLPWSTPSSPLPSQGLSPDPWAPPARDSTSPPPDQGLSPDSWVPTPPSAKPVLPTATAVPQPPGHGNIFFCSIIIWTLLCIPRGSSNTICTDLTVGVPLAGTPPVSRTSRSSSDSLSRRSNRLSVAPAYHKIINCRNHPLQFGAHRGAPAIHRLN